MEKVKAGEGETRGASPRFDFIGFQMPGAPPPAAQPGTRFFRESLCPQRCVMPTGRRAKGWRGGGGADAMHCRGRP